MDVIVMIDGCPKGGKDAWDAQITSAKTLVNSFSKKKAQIALISYCGPRTWSGVSKCTGKSTKKVNMEKTCKVKIVQHFTNDKKKLKDKLTGLEMQKGMKLMSLAFLAAKSEMALGRKKAQTAVIGYVGGPPLSERKTTLAATVLRKSARLLLVPTSKLSPLKLFKKVVTRRWQENLVVVSSAKKLAKPDQVTHIIANICPKKRPKLKIGRGMDEMMGDGAMSLDL
jgi:hypothetical protein